MSIDNDSSWLDDQQDENLPEDALDTVILRRFTDESEAQIVSANLSRHNIPNFLSNALMNQLLPMGHGVIALHVHKSDYERASKVLDNLDATSIQDLELDLDNGQVVVTKAPQQAHRRLSVWYIAIIVLIIILLLFHAYFSSEDGFKIW